MITLRMLGIAAALALALPFGFAVAHHAPWHVTVEGGNIVEMSADVVADVTDIALIEPPQTYDRVAIHNAPEQLVEGHTVFLTLDIPIVPNVTNWTLDIVGNVSCEFKHNETGVYWMGIPVPTRINEAHLECHAGDRVYATPDPFYDSEETVQTQSAASPTGRVFPFTTPNGESGEAIEYSYEVTIANWYGEPVETRTLYMWSAPVMSSWLHGDGKLRSWYCPLPVDRLQEMGITTFGAYLEGDPRLPDVVE